MRFGAIGTNFITDWFADACKGVEGAEFGAVYSRNMARAEECVKRNGGKPYDDYDAMLRDDILDAIYVASPNFLHLEHTVKALRAGKHVFLEKPAALTEAEIDIMIAEAKAADRILMEGLVHVYTPAFAALKKAIEKIGTVRRVSMTMCQYSRRYDAFKRGEHQNAFDPTLNNRGLQDVGIYCTSIMAALFGMPKIHSHIITYLDNGFEAQGTILGEYPGVIAEIRYSKLTNGVNGAEIEGEKGVLRSDAVRAPSRIWIERKGEPDEEIWSNETRPVMCYELEAFLKYCEEGTLPLADLEVSKLAARIIDEALAKAGVTV